MIKVKRQSYFWTLNESKYGVKITGKPSDLYRFFKDNMEIKTEITAMSEFERSFHLLPEKFTLSSRCKLDHLSLRKQIHNEITSNFLITENTIERTFNLVDEKFFSGLLKYRLQASGKNLTFRVSTKMVKTAGSMATKSTSYEITISNRLNEVIGNKLNSGINCNGPVDAFIVTVQHEIIHLIVHLEMDRLGISHRDAPDLYKSHGSLFKYIGEQFFGLTESTHHFFDHNDIDVDTTLTKVNRATLNMGDQVQFKSKDGFISGKVAKLNPKRARIMITDTTGYDVLYEALYHI